MARVRQHEPLRVPEHWRSQDRAFAIQLERIIDDIYIHMNNADAWKNVYPVGSVYISVDDTPPSDIFGGEWEAVTTSLDLYMWKRIR